MVVAVVLLVVFMGLFWRECWLDNQRFARQQIIDNERLLHDFARFIEQQKRACDVTEIESMDESIK